MPKAPFFLETKHKGEEKLATFIGEKLGPVIKPLQELLEKDIKQFKKLPFELKPEVREFLSGLIGKGLDLIPEFDITDIFDPTMGAATTVRSAVKQTRRAAMASRLAVQSTEIAKDIVEPLVSRSTRKLNVGSLFDPEALTAPVPKDVQTRALLLTQPIKTNPTTREIPIVFRKRSDAEINVRTRQGTPGLNQAEIDQLPKRERAKFSKGETRPEKKRLLVDQKTNQNIVLKEELPQTLYHVTGRSDEIVESGLLKGQAGFNAGGLGGGGLNGVSVATDRKSARLIQRELGRIAELANNAPTRAERSAAITKTFEALDAKKTTRYFFRF